MTASSSYLWYIPNVARGGHRGDTSTADLGGLDSLTAQAEALEQNGWQGALVGTGWGRPDTFTIATAFAARTKTFEPLIAIRPGYWRPAHFASAAASLDRLSGGRVRVNIVSGQDDLAAYGDVEQDQAQRYGRTREFMRLVRRLWTEEAVTFEGEHFQVKNSTVEPRIQARDGRPHPKLYFGGASDAAERVAATEADVQLFWGEPLAGLAERIDRLKTLCTTLDRDLPPLEFGLRITTVVRETRDAAWADAEAKVEQMAKGAGGNWQDHRGPVAVGQQRLLDLAERGDVLDDNLYTAPGRFGGGGAGTTWLVGSVEDVAASLRKYRDLGISHFILSDTPYLQEIARQGQKLLPLLRR
ncbi:LLM class flavin-dependent oxidoreductase [Rhizobium sp. SSA_523]|uniref:LLM class flavin-dependent oxidoreductase n=1 Tax=Rhizobium sp. SSA_523 TaxID=2952477 RepID=UPI0020917B1A|nr:LLM class flavin-dependent oxidoreductase [Rhizobium sp. SSA_523]MCO5733290.1 LLM class flavin-dependent oxidoreductase [Rhizobium sp. SSA_523]WKC21727.1 LLM class flavin-dependent oxidoreductase [Rhizobium sp. SSA_523]